jgi:hypothetical protein
LIVGYVRAREGGWMGWSGRGGMGEGGREVCERACGKCLAAWRPIPWVRVQADTTVTEQTTPRDACIGGIAKLNNERWPLCGRSCMTHAFVTHKHWPCVMEAARARARAVASMWAGARAGESLAAWRGTPMMGTGRRAWRRGVRLRGWTE